MTGTGTFLYPELELPRDMTGKGTFLYPELELPRDTTGKGTFLCTELENRPGMKEKGTMNIALENRSMHSNGFVLGRLKFKDTNGVMIDCTALGIRGKSIPLDVDGFIADISSDATFILFVEKSLVKVPFYDQYSCIIVTTKGPPDEATRLFLTKISLKLKLPVVAFLDCTPRCFKILGDLIHLDFPRLIWLGITSSYVRTNPKHSRLMQSRDISKCKNLLKECYFPEKYHIGFADELHLMVDEKRTLKLNALPYKYVIDVYLPGKLRAYGLLG